MMHPIPPPPFRHRRLHAHACRSYRTLAMQAAQPKVCVYTIALNEKKHVQDFLKHSKVRKGS